MSIKTRYSRLNRYFILKGIPVISTNLITVRMTSSFIQMLRNVKVWYAFLYENNDKNVLQCFYNKHTSLAIHSNIFS